MNPVIARIARIARRALPGVFSRRWRSACAAAGGGAGGRARGRRPPAAAMSSRAADLLLRTQFDASGVRIRSNSKKYQSGV
ncbi:hypothetical protein J3J51_15595 [Burkholderia pseudomallei]|nr:hypothetical protein [Burkholderia pseudomallei]MBO3059817.1 hypothetical protein [Burkholderia pseudomallei]QTB41537.1 hypothetical protein J3B47_10225 [Burkholderia pseudomallei]QTB66840.1 hypothetical protein J3J51_15595 [Burkholderia pseudomallei]